VKRNGMSELTRTLSDKRYRLCLQNQYHEDVFMGAIRPVLRRKSIISPCRRSSCKARVRRMAGYGLMFEALSDECYAFLRIREQQRRVSLVQTWNGGNTAAVYLRRVPAPALRPQAVNKLAVLAIHNEHWFFINGTLVGHQVIPRLPYTRLDVGIVAGAQQQVVCEFQAFRVVAPPAMRLYPTLEQLIGRSVDKQERAAAIDG
jgi:hypothetical protein